MDGKNFDKLVKTFAAGASRRTVLKRIAGGILGGTVAVTGLGQATAKRCGHPGQSCATDTDCCGALPCIDGTCRPAHGQPSGNCGGGCPTGQGCCSGTCIDLTTTTNCGACGNACGGGDDCNAPACASGSCGTIPANDGAPCNGGTGTCASGTCVPTPSCDATSCPDGCCDTNGVCQGSGPSTCGTGGAACVTCQGSQTCTNGTCQTPSTFGCTAGSQCDYQCPQSGNGNCLCGTTWEGAPTCYDLAHGCAGHSCGSDSDCSDTGGTCIQGFCSTPNLFCTTDAECGSGSVCVNVNGGCGGCDNYTGGTQGICQPVCTS